MYTIIALFGPSGSGKDYLCKKLESYFPDKVHKIVSYTTRPKRDGEIDGLDYHFITNLKATELDWLELSTFNNDWKYGTTFDCLVEDKVNVGAYNIQGIHSLLEMEKQKDNLLVFPVYVEAEPKIRLTRALRREENPDCHEICRRFLADEKDFEKLDFDYIEWDNNQRTRKPQFPDDIMLILSAHRMLPGQ
jgi:guanylate kinase